METNTINNNNITLPTEEGFFGNYGGQFLPEGLKAEFKKITECFNKLKDDVIFNKELNENAVCKYFLHTAEDGKNYNTKYYNLDVIIAFCKKLI